MAKKTDKKAEENGGLLEKIGDTVSAVGEKIGETVAPVTETFAPVGERVGGAVAAVGEKVSELLPIGSDASSDQGAEDENAEAENEGLPTGSTTKGAPVPTLELPEYLRKRRSELGRVVSDKMEKTVVVSVDRSKPHPLYKKIVRHSVKFMAHDELGSTMGDTVRIVESRPMSRNKRWQVVEIVQRAEQL